MWAVPLFLASCCLAAVVNCVTAAACVALISMGTDGLKHMIKGSMQRWLSSK